MTAPLAGPPVCALRLLHAARPHARTTTGGDLGLLEAPDRTYGIDSLADDKVRGDGGRHGPGDRCPHVVVSSGAIDGRGVPAATQHVARWSSTSPAACMNA